MSDKNKPIFITPSTEDIVNLINGVKNVDESALNVAETAFAANGLVRPAPAPEKTATPTKPTSAPQNRTRTPAAPAQQSSKPAPRPVSPQTVSTSGKVPVNAPVKPPVKPVATQGAKSATHPVTTTASTPSPIKTAQEKRVLRKYILTSETKHVEGRTLHRIKAVRDFGDVKSGDLGGWIESDRNLSHDGYCWIYDNAESRERAVVSGDAMLYGRAYASGNARVYDSAKMYDSTEVYGNGKVYGNARITGFSVVHGDAQVYDYGCLSDNSEIKDRAQLHEDATVVGTSIIGGRVDVCGHSVIQRIVYGDRVFRDVDDIPARY